MRECRSLQGFRQDAQELWEAAYLKVSGKAGTGSAAAGMYGRLSDKTGFLKKGASILTAEFLEIGSSQTGHSSE